MTITTPLVCVFGIVTNLVIIYVVSHKLNRKELKENQYSFMRANALTNLPIFVIHILLLVSECQTPFGVFCSRIHKSYFAQYFKIIFGEYFSNLFKLLSNFTFVCFALCRLSLVGKEHSTLTNKVAKISPKKLLLVIFFPCAGLCVVKAFSYVANRIQFEDEYPLPFAYLYSKISLPLIFTYLSINFFLDFVNYIFFWLVNLVIDINLLLCFRKAMREKAQNFSNLMLRRDQKEGEDPMTKLIKMVVLNAFTGMLLKCMASFMSLYDIVGLIKFFVVGNIDSGLIVAVFGHQIKVCLYELLCSTLEQLADTWCITSLSINFFFIYEFDKKFKVCFEKLRTLN